MQKRFMSWMTDPTVWTAWRQQLQTATTTPWLWRELTDRGAELFPRFAEAYRQLRSLPRRMRRHLQRQWACSLAGIALALVLTPNASWAANFTAGTAAELIAAINSANATPDADTITLTNNITLTAVDNTDASGGNPNGLPVVSTTITIEGNNHTIARDSNAPSFRLLRVNSPGVLELRETTLSGGQAGDTGGGLFTFFGTAILDKSTVSGNSGSGIFNALGYVTLTNSTVAGNTGTITGGILNERGSVTLTNSTVSGNAGGGINNAFGYVTLTNSTVSGNTGQFTGGIYIDGGYLTLTNSLISGNSSVFFNGKEVRISSFGGSISTDLAPNVLGHSGLSTGQALYGFTPSATDITATSDGTTPTALSAILDPTLANNSGPTLTHALVTGSPAIDAGDNALCLETDQRGALRPFGTTCDIGSVESYPFVFTGFFHPVDNLPTVNEIKAGKALQVKFSLGGNFGLTQILGDGSPSSQQIACASGAPIDAIEEETTSNSGLTYDATTNQYKYTWKTQKAWAGTCRQLKVTLADGSMHTALFTFK